MATPMPEASAPASWLPAGSLMFGILSLLLFWLPIIGLLLGVTGIILASTSLRSGRNFLATAGLVTGIIGTAISFIPILLGLFALLSHR